MEKKNLPGRGLAKVEKYFPNGKDPDKFQREIFVVNSLPLLYTLIPFVPLFPYLISR